METLLIIPQVIKEAKLGYGEMKSAPPFTRWPFDENGNQTLSFLEGLFPLATISDLNQDS